MPKQAYDRLMNSPHLAFEELFNVLTVRFRVCGDVDRTGVGLLYPQLDSPTNLC